MKGPNKPESDCKQLVTAVTILANTNCKFEILKEGKNTFSGFPVWEVSARPRQN